MVGPDIRLSSLLKEKYIELDLKEKDKKKVLAELVDGIASKAKLKNRKEILDALLKREKLGSTGIGNGVAIPHARSARVKAFILAFGRQSQGIDFGALDGEKTYIFFVLLSPEENIGGHLKILAEISRLVKDKFIVDRLKAAADKKQVSKVISTYER
ncbi:MAG TPA: PTS sugar transporter subunit IIA [Candidatus Omnitrophota bacterium]|nr:PTS sugar transporter subunit IIA [Candidatus Omnitrophota bacterium]HQJ15684.1 PTS sugar transporter subunit IIA [Candidatus Omnitrophota bacterium]